MPKDDPKSEAEQLREKMLQHFEEEYQQNAGRKFYLVSYSRTITGNTFARTLVDWANMRSAQVEDLQFLNTDDFGRFVSLRTNDYIALVKLRQ